MQVLMHQKYIDGPLVGQVVESADWPDDVNYRLITINYSQHLYVRRAFTSTEPGADGQCIIRHLGQHDSIHDNSAVPVESEFTYQAPDQASHRNLEILCDRMIKILDEHERALVQFEILNESKKAKCTQILHSSVGRDEIMSFARFVHELTWAYKYDDSRS